MWQPDYPLKNTRPADYNPRHLSAEAFERLQQSIREIGMLKPLIVTDDGLLIAGHQRSRTLLSMGVETCPAHILKRVGREDEIRFNQVHNAADREVCFWQVRVPPQTSTGWVTIEPRDIEVVKRVKMGGKFAEVNKLLAKHGEWGNAVATLDGEVIVGQLYAAAVKVHGLPLRLAVVPAELRQRVVGHFSGEYGVFSFEHLPRDTWNQSLAQPFRLRADAPTGMHGSYVYKHLVFDLLRGNKDSVRLLDFGAGQKDHVTELARHGYQAIGIEFFHQMTADERKAWGSRPGVKMRLRTGAETGLLNVEEIHRDIDVLCAQLRARGRFDVVVCDTVINSVDSLQAEADVMTSIAALCSPGGTVIFSGRDADGSRHTDEESELHAAKNRAVEFIDANGFSANFAQGVWWYQKFHTTAEARALSQRYIGPVQKLLSLGSRWSLRAIRTVDIPSDQAEASLAREFDLPWPGGKSVDRSQEIVAAYRAALARESRNQNTP